MYQSDGYLLRNIFMKRKMKLLRVVKDFEEANLN